MVPKDYQEKFPPNHLQLNFSGWDLDMVLYNQDTVFVVVVVVVLILIFTLFYFTILYWFCHTLTWIHHGCICNPKHEPPLPPPSPQHPSGSSPCTSPKHAVSCIGHRLVIQFLHDGIHVSEVKSSLQNHHRFKTELWTHKKNSVYPSIKIN